jgi:hypothetical protein
MTTIFRHSSESWNPFLALRAFAFLRVLRVTNRPLVSREGAKKRQAAKKGKRRKGDFSFAGLTS